MVKVVNRFCEREKTLTLSKEEYQELGSIIKELFSEYKIIIREE